MGLFDQLATNVGTFVQSPEGGNMLSDLGAGLLTGNNWKQGFSNAGQRAIALAPERQQQAKANKQVSMTQAWIQANRPDLLPLLEAGATPVEVLSTAMSEQQAERQRADEQQRREQLAQFITDPTAQQAYLAGEVDWEGARNFGQADPLKPTSSMQEYQFAQSQGYTGSFQEYETEMKRAGATNIDFNANQGVAAGFADRMAAANAVLDDPKLTQAQTDVVQSGLGAVPGIGNFLTTAEKQMADQAQRDFINAILRRESGAVISPSEFDNAAKQYFPQPGDDPLTIEQKKRNRQLAIEGVSRSAGPAYQPPPAMGGSQPVDFSTYFGGQ